MTVMISSNAKNYNLILILWWAATYFNLGGHIVLQQIDARY